MKIGLLADSHYSSAPLTCGRRYNNQSLRKIKEALAHFAHAHCDLVIILGDVTDTESSRELEKDNLRQIAKVLIESGLEIMCLMGNHDAFSFTPDEFYTLLGERFRPRTMAFGNISLLFLDTCYFSTGVHYAPGDNDWTDTFYPHMDALKNTLHTVQSSAYVFMHQNIDPEIRQDHRLSNADQVRTVLEESGKVNKVFQGHFHQGNRNMHRGIEYITLQAMCENENAYQIVELV